MAVVALRPPRLRGAGDALALGVEVVAIDVDATLVDRLREADVDLVFIEVQQGDYFGEDDIVRQSDDYGRAG